MPPERPSIAGVYDASGVVSPSVSGGVSSVAGNDNASVGHSAQRVGGSSAGAVDGDEFIRAGSGAEDRGVAFRIHGNAGEEGADRGAGGKICGSHEGGDATRKGPSLHFDFIPASEDTAGVDVMGCP